MIVGEAAIAWAAGLFEGEGSFSSLSNHKQPGVYLRAGMTQTDKDVIERFQEIVGFGTIYERDPKPPSVKRQYVWIAGKDAEFRELVSLFWPYLGQRRRRRAAELLELRDEWVGSRRDPCSCCVCGATFTPSKYGPRPIYCSSVCRSLAFRANRETAWQV